VPYVIWELINGNINLGFGTRKMCNTHAHEILLGRIHMGDIRQSLTYVPLVKEV
jgi:hypothetical protein